MFLAWLAARSGLRTLRDPPRRKFALAMASETFYGEFQLLLGLAGIWLSWPFMSTSSVGLLAHRAKQTNSVFRRSQVLFALVFTLCFVCRILRTCLLEAYHTAIPL